MRRILLALALLAACGGDKSTNPASDSIAGSYTLRTINGSALPYVLQSGTTSAKVTSDVITVADGGSWSEQGTYQLTQNGSTSNQVISDGGTWSRSGTNVAFTSTTTSGYSGIFTGSGFALSDGTYNYSFTK